MINIDFDKLNITGKIVVGVSTGSDSMALLFYLIHNYKDTIICAHINHNVREQSNIEEKYLEKFCLDNNVIFEKMKIETYKENNFENEARKIRYKFYEDILNKYSSSYLFLAHHADDLMETILMKIVRGSNINGYAGIKKISKMKNYYIVRPLLDYTKEEILAYAKKNNIKFYEDITNNDTSYTRNRFRANIIPILKKEDKNVHRKFIKYSNDLLEYNDYINYEVRMKLKDIYTNNKLDLIKFNELHPFLKKNILYTILNDIYQNKDDIIKTNHILNILKLIESSKPNLTISLPNNLYAIKQYNILKFSQELKNSNNDYRIKINLNHDIKLKNYIIKIISNSKTDGNDICRLYSKEISLPLYIRNKKDGDYIEIKGLNGKKKVKEIFIENKMPINVRDTYPLLVDNDDNILWIPNIKKSKFNKKKSEKYDIILKYCETKKGDYNE